MSPAETVRLRALLGELDDSRAVVVRAGRAPAIALDRRIAGLMVLWREARAEANSAYRLWREVGGRDGYFVYLAAEERADAAEEQLYALDTALRDGLGRAAQPIAA